MSATGKGLNKGYLVENLMYPKEFFHVFPFFRKDLYYILKQLIKKGVEEVIVFGSVIGRTCTIYSDIDICVITDNPLTLDYSGIYCVEDIDIVFRTREEYIRDKDNYHDVCYDIAREGITIYERN